MGPLIAALFFYQWEESQRLIRTVKRHLTLSIILTYGVFFQCSLGITRPNCSELLRLQAKQQKEIPTPIGISQKQLDELKEIFINHPDFAELEAVVLFGSRTHFSYGYPPNEKSDLDVMFFFKSQLDPITILDRSDILNKHLVPISEATGIHISQQIPSFITLKSYIEFETSNPPDFNQAQAIHNEMIEKAKSQNWNRIQLKQAISSATHGMITHRDRIILIRESAKSSLLKKQLEELGYSNVYLIQSRKSSSFHSQ